MTRSKKIWLGVLTFLPIVCAIIYIICFALYFISFASIIEHEASDASINNPGFLVGSFGLMFLMILIAVISSIGLMIYYIIHANSNPNFDSNQKLIWILVLVLAGGIGNIVYYFVEILPKKQNDVNLSNKK
ncbi:MAG: hypothetical protein CMC13_08265 [Flavobacteriaceae bacterium]|nr:hypothetical protein [Flavobacteriaceae bacterium]|tara:strand:- start:20362 stop:20754 length:393 start_codon:yes stop_codon:yes gene_type:complete